MERVDAIHRKGNWIALLSEFREKPFEPYRILNDFSEDWAGTLYPCIHRKTKRKYFIRAICAEDYPGLTTAQWWDFVEGAERLSLFTHPTLLPYEDVIPVGSDKVFFVFGDLSSGKKAKDLDGLLKSREKGHLVPKDACAAFLQLVEGILSLHNHGVIHRGLHPKTILLDWSHKPLRLQISCYGFSPLWRDPNRNPKQLVLPPTAYTAPELLNDPFIDDHPHADLYSLGGIFWKLLTGKGPPEKEEEFAILEEKIGSDLNDELTKQIHTVLSLTLERDKGKRFFRCDELVSYLKGDTSIGERLEHFLSFAQSGTDRLYTRQIKKKKTLAYGRSGEYESSAGSLADQRLSKNGSDHTLDLDWHVVPATISSHEEELIDDQEGATTTLEKFSEDLQQGNGGRRGNFGMASSFADELQGPDSDRPLPEPIPEGWEREALKKDDALHRKEQKSDLWLWGWIVLFVLLLLGIFWGKSLFPL